MLRGPLFLVDIRSLLIGARGVYVRQRTADTGEERDNDPTIDGARDQPGELNQEQ